MHLGCRYRRSIVVAFDAFIDNGLVFIFPAHQYSWFH